MNTFRLPLLLPVLLLAVACSQQGQSLSPTAADGLSPPSFAASPSHLPDFEGHGLIPDPDDGINHVGNILTITNVTPVLANHCGLFWGDYQCTVSNPLDGTSFASTCSLPDTLVVAVGDQFEVQTQTACNGQLDLTLTAVDTTPSVIGNIQDDGQNYVGRTIIITDPKRRSIADFCGDTFNEYRSVVSDPGAGRATVTTVAINLGELVQPGDRFLVTAQAPCDDRLELTLEQK